MGRTIFPNALPAPLYPPLVVVRALYPVLNFSG